jgi:uncharacterized protein (DUF983 family)
MATTSTRHVSAVGRAGAVLLMRCPRCCRGGVYRGFLRMRKDCAICGLVFEREPGYFTGAMYASYTLGIFGTMPVWLALLLTEQPYALILGVSVGMIVVLMPVFFHYSRVLWLHFDFIINPGTFETPPKVT